jgi:hypothetical protein
VASWLCSIRAPFPTKINPASSEYLLKNRARRDDYEEHGDGVGLSPGVLEELPGELYTGFDTEITAAKMGKALPVSLTL